MMKSSKSYGRRSKLSRQLSEPVLKVGGRAFDISNLFPGGVANPGQQVEEQNGVGAPTRLRRAQSGDAIPRKLGYEETDDFDQPRYPRRDRTTSRRQSRRGRRKSLPEKPLYPKGADVLTDAKLETEPAALVFQRTPRRKSISSSIMTGKEVNNLKDAPLSSAEKVERKLAPAVVMHKIKRPPTNYSLGGIWDRSSSPLRDRSPSPPPYVQRGNSPSHERNYTVRERTPSPQRSSSFGQSEPVTPDSDVNFEDHSMEFDALPEIEVAPGVYKELRGSKETIYAVEQGYAVTTSCFCCGDKLKCLPDVEMVICPDCRIVSPLGQVDEDAYGRKPAYRPPRGVGLGLKLSEISEFQSGYASYASY